ncbi:MAG: ATP synthase subunit I [Gammaproteobacteria bacterium]|nr:MAG: ATP synthase subunit I [Gammaproteobacteria bacterium]
MINRLISGSFLDRIGAALRIQLVLVGLAAMVLFAVSGKFQALSALFGGAMATLNLVLLEWRRYQADSGRALSAGQSLWVLYRSAIERFALVLALFALGMGMLRLEPLSLLIGFVAGQFGLLLTGTKRNN